MNEMLADDGTTYLPAPILPVDLTQETVTVTYPIQATLTVEEFARRYGIPEEFLR